MVTSDAPLIRSDYESGLYTKKALAEKYHVHPDTISNVLSRCEDRDVYVRKTWSYNLLITPYLDVIRQWLSSNPRLQATTIHQKLVNLGSSLSQSTIDRAVKHIKYELDLSAIRYETSPGKQAQADWGTFKGFSATIDGVERPLYAFFLILGYSRMKYVEFVTSMTTSVLIKCIENALTYFGGSPEEIMFDNMIQVVNRCLTERGSGVLERTLIPEFTSFAEYIGFDITLQRIARPQQKGKVERTVGFFKDSFIPTLSKKTGHNLADLNRQAIEWCDEVNSKVHDTTKEIPFNRLKDENLSVLPEIPFYQNNKVKVQKDGSVCYKGRVYSVDNRFAGEEGSVIDLEDTIFAYFDNTLVILGKRNLPVVIRHRYSHTKDEGNLKQKKQKVSKSDISHWLDASMPSAIQSAWRLSYE